MPKSLRIVPETASGDSQTITFVLAIGTVRQMCGLETTFRTQNQAFNYLHKHRTAFERIARTRLSRSQVDDGVIHLTML